MNNTSLKLSCLLKKKFKEEKRKAHKEFITVLSDTINEYVRIESRPWERKRILFKEKSRQLAELVIEELSNIFPEHKFLLETQEYSIFPDCPCIDWRDKNVTK